MADFNGNGSTDVSDFNIWNKNKFLAPAAAEVFAGRVPRSPLPVATTAIRIVMFVQTTDQVAANDPELVFKQPSQLKQIADVTPQLAVVDLTRFTNGGTAKRTKHSRDQATDQIFAEIDEWKAGSMLLNLKVADVGFRSARAVR